MKSLKEFLSEKIKWNGERYQYDSKGNYTVFKSEGEVHLDIKVNNMAGWSTDPHFPNELRLMDSGKKRATYVLKSGNIETHAKNLINIADKETTFGWKSKLKIKDVADVIRISIDMQQAKDIY